jgi:tagatose-1,6-bisphosphate aldolase
MYLNIEHIVEVYEDSSGKTNIDTRLKDDFEVDESYDEVVQKIKDACATVQLPTVVEPLTTPTPYYKTPETSDLPKSLVGPINLC